MRESEGLAKAGDGRAMVGDIFGGEIGTELTQAGTGFV